LVFTSQGIHSRWLLPKTGRRFEARSHSEWTLRLANNVPPTRLHRGRQARNPLRYDYPPRGPPCSFLWTDSHDAAYRFGRSAALYEWSLAQEATSLNAASLDAKIVEMFETFSAV
jgi:hypothetical protein